METLKVLAAQGRYDEIDDQDWRSLTEWQKKEILDVIPINTSIESYAKMCPDPSYYQDWYLDRAIKTSNLAGPQIALEILNFAYKMNQSPSYKNTMGDLTVYSRLLALLSSTYHSVPNDSQKRHIVELIDQLRFPLNIEELLIEPWLGTALLVGELGLEVNSILSSRLLEISGVDRLYSLSELNCRQVSVGMETAQRQALDLGALLSSLKSSKDEGVVVAKTLLGPAGFDIDTVDDLKEALNVIIRDNQALAVSAADEFCDWSVLEHVLLSNTTGLSTVNLQLAFECLSLL